MLRLYSSCQLSQLAGRRDGEEVLVGGIMNKVKLTVTKKTGEKMAIVEFEDLTGTCEVLVFPNTYKNVAVQVRVDNIVFIKGKVSLREEQPKLLASDIILPDDVKGKFTSAVFISLPTPGLDEFLLDNLKNVLGKHHGKVPVMLNFAEPTGRRTRISIGRDFAVRADESMVEEVEALLGSGAVNLQLGL